MYVYWLIMLVSVALSSVSMLFYTLYTKTDNRHAMLLPIACALLLPLITFGLYSLFSALALVVIQ